MLSHLLSATALIAVSSAAPAPASSSGFAAVPLLWKYGGLPKITTDVVFGTPGQNSSVPTIFDTGSAAYWVAGPDNLAFYGTDFKVTKGPCNETLTPYYDWTVSKSHSGPVVNTPVQSFAYGGNAHVVFSYYSVNDTIGFAQTGYPVIPNRQVAVSNETLLTTGNYDTCPEAGYPTDNSILGLSPKSTFRAELVGDGVITSNTLSIWFDSAPGDIKGTFSGTAVFGALPPSDKYEGDLVEVESDWSEGSYRVATPAFKARALNATAGAAGTTVPLDDQPATCLVDTGSPNLELPISLGNLTSITGLTNIPDTSVVAYNGSCESIPAAAALDFEWDGVTISLPYRSLIRGYLDGVEPGYCVLSLFVGELDCTLGSPFFSAATIVFDDTAKKISLAQGGISAGAAEGSGLDEVVPLGKGQ